MTMSLDPDSPDDYLVGHLEDALARDPRVAEQGLHARLRRSGTERTVVVSGTVVAREAKAAIAEVVHAVLPGAAVEDETVIADRGEQAGIEELA